MSRRMAFFAAGPFHLNWGIQRALTTTLSGFGLYQLAVELGVTHLSKLEACTEFRATSVVLINVLIVIEIALQRTAPTNQKDDVRAVFELMRNLLVGWYAHFRGIRLGRIDLQVIQDMGRRGLWDVRRRGRRPRGGQPGVRYGQQPPPSPPLFSLTTRAPAGGPPARRVESNCPSLRDCRQKLVCPARSVLRFRALQRDSRGPLRRRLGQHTHVRWRDAPARHRRVPGEPAAAVEELVRGAPV